MKRLFIVVLLALTAATVITAQTPKGKRASGAGTIESIMIRGNRRIPESDIKDWISARERDVYKRDKVDGDVRALFSTGHFDDVKVYVEGGVRGGKIITFEVRDRPLIAGIDYGGIDSTQQADVKEEWRGQKIELFEGSEYDPVVIRRAAKVMQELLIRKYGQAVRVLPYVEQQAVTEVLITFKVEAGN